jgi:trehalose 6-phosphate phosphatase
MGGHTTAVPASPAETLAEAVSPLTDAPRQAAIFCDIDGTLAPIVQRADQAKVPDRISSLLGALGRRYACVACVSGRSATEARRLVGVGSIAYAGAHGAELLEPGESRPTVVPAFASWADRVRRFAAERDTSELRRLRVRLEDKGAIHAFHWRGAPDEDVARTRVEGIAREAETEGLEIHWGRKVLEVRPPVQVDKGQAVRELALRHQVSAALFGGDDVTDLDGFAALDQLVAQGELEHAVRVGVRSEEGPSEIVERADIVVDGVRGFAEVLRVLAGA